MQAVGPSSTAVNITAWTGRGVCWLARRGLRHPRLSLRSEGDAAPSAGGRRCSTGGCKRWEGSEGHGGVALQTGWVAGEYDPFLTGSFPMERGSVWWAPCLVAGGEVREAVARRTCLPRGLPWASLDRTPWRNIPLAAPGPLSCVGLLAETPRERLIRGNAAWDAGARWYRCCSTALYHQRLWRKLARSAWNLTSQWVSRSLKM